MASKQQTSKFAAQSAFVFRGKVIKLKAATLEGVDTDSTAIVQVDHVITAPPMFTAINGQQITVRFKSLTGITKGSVSTFFTNGWIFGASIGVDAVGVVQDAETHAITATVQQASTGSQDDALKARLDSAEMAVVGTVSKVEPSEKGTTHISEHDPNWHEATVDVDEVVKGKKSTKQVTMLFPKSDDVRWYKIPKYKEGQQGIWLLQKGKKQDPKGIQPKAFNAIPDGADVLTTLHPSDFLPLNELGRVKAILKDQS